MKAPGVLVVERQDHQVCADQPRAVGLGQREVADIEGHVAGLEPLERLDAQVLDAGGGAIHVVRLDRLPALDSLSIAGQQDRVLGVEAGDGRGIAVIEGILVGRHALLDPLFRGLWESRGCAKQRHDHKDANSLHFPLFLRQKTTSHDNCWRRAFHYSFCNRKRIVYREVRKGQPTKIGSGRGRFPAAPR
jgi:hypothetical protein